MPVALRPRDLVRLGLVIPVSPSIRGTDMAKTVPGIHVSYITDSGQVAVRTTYDKETWFTVVVAADQADDAIPTLSVDEQDNLFVWYHLPGGTSRCWVSNNWGRTFIPWTDAAGKFPRSIMSSFEPAFLVSHNGAVLEVRRSLDLFRTVVSALDTLTLAAQLVAFRTDKDGTFLVFYESSGSILCRGSRSGKDWSSPVFLGAIRTRVTVAFSPGTPFPVATHWDGDIPKSTTLDLGGGEGEIGPYTLPFSVPKQYIGIVRDNDDNMWMAVQDSGNVLHVWASPDFGRNTSLKS